MTRRRHLSIRPEWENPLREGRKTIDARLVADDIADLLAHEDWRRIAPDATDASEIRRLLEGGHGAPPRRAHPRCTFKPVRGESAWDGGLRARRSCTRVLARDSGFPSARRQRGTLSRAAAGVPAPRTMKRRHMKFVHESPRLSPSPLEAAPPAAREASRQARTRRRPPQARPAATPAAPKSRTKE